MTQKEVKSELRAEKKCVCGGGGKKARKHRGNMWPSDGSSGARCLKTTTVSQQQWKRTNLLGVGYQTDEAAFNFL